MKTIKNLKAEEIRKSILQLAIQGKLVKQDPNDEPASELVKRIYAEKQRLIKEGKIKKDKNESFIFKGDDNCYYEKIGNSAPVKLEDLPFDIPDNWTWVRHNSIFEIFGGSQPPKDKFIGYPKEGYIRLYQIRDYGPKPEPVYIPIKDAHKVTVKGDILLARYGASVGKVFFAEDGAYNVAMAKVEKLYVNDYIDKMFLYTFYKSSLYQSLVLNNSRSAQAGFNKEDLNSLLIPLPPLEEQIRIVEKINSFEPLIAQYSIAEERMSILEEEFPEKLKKSILQYAIEGKLVKQDPNDEPASVLLERIKAEKERLIKEVKIKCDKNESYIYQGDDKNYYENLPSGWAKTFVRNIISLTSGTDLTPDEYSSDNIGVPYLTGASNISEDDSIIINRYTNARYVNSHKDEILLTCKGTIGKIAINDIGDIHVARQFMSIRSFILNDYMVIYLKTIVAYLNSEAKSMIPGIDRNQILTKEIMLPPIQEQNRIAYKVSSLLSQISY
ncbi:MAG: restriction endonuclease subunit S [Erysipelotrichaceae bacterium]|nr:restriction endonuclease subunit S [Erysipelotrichaceae bacterium]